MTFFASALVLSWIIVAQGLRNVERKNDPALLRSASCALQTDNHASEIHERNEVETPTACEGLATALGRTRHSTFDDSAQLHRLNFVRTSKDAQPPANRSIVWVIGYARSGSSTALSMVSAAGQETDLGMDGITDSDHSVFAIFEPCHWGWWVLGDRLTGKLRKQGCRGLLDSISSCDFSQVKSLYFWKDPHTVTPGVSKYSPSAASSSCNQADIVAFKTIFYGHDLKNKALPILNMHPQARIISIVRDPRGIYASWRTTFPFKLRTDRSLLTEICDNFAQNLEVKHDRVLTIKFEDLVKQPSMVVQTVYRFLGMEFGERQNAWIASTFSADCGHQDGYSDCKTNSTAHAAKWKSVMKQDEIDYFLNYPPCVTVAKTYNYEL